MYEIVFFAVAAVALVVAYNVTLGRGVAMGRTWERARVEHILRGALLTRFSPTIHQALVCIAGNQTEAEMKSRLEEISLRADGYTPE